MEGAPKEHDGTTDERNNAKKHCVLSLSELSRRIHCPVDYKKVLPSSENMAETSLSYIPWKLVQQQSLLDETSKKDPSERLDASTKGELTKNSIIPKEDEQQVSFPSYSYLDLRRRQNHSWASDRQKEGMELLFINPTKAESKFLEGLDLVPDHVDLLASYGKLLVSSNDFVSAEAKLKRALQVAPSHKVAKEELDRLEKRRSLIQGRMQQNQERLLNRKIKVAKESSVYNDVLMERALAMGDGDAKEEDVEEYSREREKRSHRDRKHSKRKKKRRRRRRYYSSSSATSENSSVTSNGDGGNDDASSRDEEGDPGRSALASDAEDDSRKDRKQQKDRKRRKRHERKHRSKKKKKRAREET